MVDAKRNEKSLDSDPGVLAASGMIAGEGLVGVLIAFLVAASGKFPSLASALASIHFASKDFTYLKGVAAVIGGLAIVIAICVLLYRAGRSAQVEGSDAPVAPLNS
jgi:hypothetical protein